MQILNKNNINKINQKISFLYLEDQTLNEFEQNIDEKTIIYSPNYVLPISKYENIFDKVYQLPQKITPKNKNWPENWALINGFWGDSLFSLCEAFNRFGNCGIIFQGTNQWAKDIFKFIYNLNFVDKLLILNKKGQLIDYETKFIIENKKIIQNIHNNTCDLKIYNKITNQSQSLLTWNYRCLNFPEDAINYSKKIIKFFNKEAILIHPYSINSSPLQHHWEHWEKLMDFIFLDKSKQYILSGKNIQIKNYSEHTNITNLINKIPTMYHVFALSNEVSKTITTSNSLGCWCVIKKNKSKIFANASIVTTDLWKSVFFKGLGQDTWLIDVYMPFVGGLYIIHKFLELNLNIISENIQNYD